MYVFQTYDGKLFSAKNERSLVEQLRNDTIISTNDIYEFMNLVTKWTMIYNDSKLDPDTPETFIASMIDEGMLTKWSKN